MKTLLLAYKKLKTKCERYIASLHDKSGKAYMRYALNPVL